MTEATTSARGVHHLHTATEQVGDTTVQRTIEETTTIEKTGFFARAKRALEARPIRTTLGLIGATGLAVTGYNNYQDTGSVLGDLDPNRANDTGEAVAAIAGAIFGQ